MTVISITETDYTPTPSESYERISNKRKEKRYIKAVSILIAKDENNLGNVVFQFSKTTIIEETLLKLIICL